MGSKQKKPTKVRAKRRELGLRQGVSWPVSDTNMLDPLRPLRIWIGRIRAAIALGVQENEAKLSRKSLELTTSANTNTFIFIVVGLVVLRFVNLTGQPMYLDEGIYISWGSLINQSPGYAYVSLQDGKTPLFMWAMAWLRPWFSDYLVTGRVISVIAGLISITCWVLIAFQERRIYLISHFLLAALIVPYQLLIDRLALADSLMTMLASIGLMLLVWSGQYWWMNAALAGLFLGLSFLTKTSAKLLLVGQSLVLFRTKNIFLAMAMLALVFLVFRETIGFMRVGAHRFWTMITNKERQLTFTPLEAVKRLSDNADTKIHFSNMKLLIQYLLVYIGPILLLSVFSLTDRRAWTWWLYAIVTISGTWLVSKVTASRYYYPAVLPIVYLSAIGAHWLTTRYTHWGRLMVWGIFLITAINTVNIALQPVVANYTVDDRANFVTSHLTPHGFMGAIEIIRSETDLSQAVLGISGIWGVTDGSLVLAREEGLSAIRVDRWLDGKIVKINPLLQAPEPRKYWLIFSDGPEIATLSGLRKFAAHYEIPVPSGKMVHLFKL